MARHSLNSCDALKKSLCFFIVHGGKKKCSEVFSFPGGQVGLFRMAYKWHLKVLKQLWCSKKCEILFCFCKQERKYQRHRKLPTECPAIAKRKVKQTIAKWSLGRQHDSINVAKCSHEEGKIKCKFLFTLPGKG